MPKYVCIAGHLSVDELENRYRRATDPIERSHFQIIWLLAQGKRVHAVAEVTGYCANWIRILARGYNQERPQVLADRHVVLVLDRAGWHSSQMLTVPDGIHLVFLPPYSRRPPTG